jgi:hypothetical protein
MDGQAGRRPEAIHVDVFCDGEKVETLLLNRENNWSAVCRPERIGSYTIRETDVPEGYRASVEQNAAGFVLTNTWEPTPTVTPSATPSATPAVTPCATPGGGSEGGRVSASTPGAVKTGDDTNVSVWIVLLTVSAVGMIILGVIKRIRGENK